MSADLILVGFTTTGDQALSSQEILEILRPHIPALMADDSWDSTELVGEFFTESEDEYDRLLNALHDGVISSLDAPVVYPIGDADSGRYFCIAGGETWGDDPCPGFNNISLLVDAIDFLPDSVGKSLGILGGGIITD